MDREGRKTGRRELRHGTKETERMGEKGWNGCRSSCRGTSLRGRFPHGSGNGDYSRRDMRQTHCAAKPNAARCDGRCSALRWTMHCTTSFHPNHSHEARRNPVSYPLKTPVVPAPRDRPTDCQKEYKELKNRTERAKRPNDERRATGRSVPKGRKKKDGQEDGASQEDERKAADEVRKHEWQALLRLPLEYHTMQVRS